MTVVRSLFLAALAVAAIVPNASAQTYIGRDVPHRGSLEISGGGAWSPGFDTHSGQAELTRSVQTDRFDLFSFDGQTNGFPALQARIGFYLTSAISIEGGIRYAKPKLEYRLSGDAESAPDETATETLSHYVFDGSVVFHVRNASFSGGRGVPFISAGAGYLRELHEGNELVETGNEFHVTGGVKYWFGSGKRRFGLRGEAGITSRQDGFDDNDARRTLPLAQGGLAFLF
jgi:hypothetical protein